MNDTADRLPDALRTLSGARTGIFFGEHEQSFDEWQAAAAGYASALTQMGICAGDRVAVLCSSRPELLAAIVGHHLAGVIHVPINARYRAAEVHHILEDCQPAAILVEDEHRALLQQVEGAASIPWITLDATGSEHRFEALSKTPAKPSPPVDPGATALIIYTSGTTGKSKGVELSYAAIGAGIGALTDLWQWSARDQLVLALPLFHVHGLCIGVHGALLHHVPIRLVDKFESAGVAAAIAAGGTIFMGVPTMYALLLEWLEAHPDSRSQLETARLLTSGSAPLPAAHFERLLQLTGHEVLERYGMTETLLTLSNPYEGERRAGSVGRPVPGCEVRVVEDGSDQRDGESGELWVRWPGMMTGYWRRPDATSNAFTDGWFRTGDVVVRRADGYFRIVGRKSVDIIKSGGFKISAREIEEVILRHPAVRECAVVGVADERWGQAIAAAIVPRPGQVGVLSLEGVASFVSAELADYKKPRHLLLMNALPRNALGKLQKHLIVQRAEDDAEPSGSG
jgi:malonyl-CoA/methylmalonyl-CoA synthetase